MFVLRWSVVCCVKPVNVPFENLKTLRRGTRGTHMTLRTTTWTDTCGTMQETCMKNKPKYHHLNLATATPHCVSTLFPFVYILLHRVACTAATTTNLARFICWNLICIAVISYFHGKLSKHAVYARLLSVNCLETLFSDLLFRHCHKSLGKTLKTFFVVVAWKLQKFRKAKTDSREEKQIVVNSNNIFPQDDQFSMISLHKLVHQSPQREEERHSQFFFLVQQHLNSFRQCSGLVM